MDWERGSHLANPSLLTNSLNEYLEAMKISGGTDVTPVYHKFMANAPTMEDINRWISNGSSTKKHVVDTWVEESVEGMPEAKKKPKKKSQIPSTATGTSSSSLRIFPLTSSRKGRPKCFKPPRKNFGRDSSSPSPNNRFIMPNNEVEDGNKGSRKNTVRRTIKFAPPKVWNQIGKQIEASFSGLVNIGSGVRQKTLQTPVKKGTRKMARSKKDTEKDKNFQDLLQVKPLYHQIGDDQQTKVNRTHDYWGRSLLQTSQIAGKKVTYTNVVVCKTEVQPKSPRENRDHLQHVFVVNGSAMAFRDCATFGFVHWFLEEKEVAQRLKSSPSRDKFYHEFDLSGFSNEEIKIKLYDGKTLIILGTRPCRGKFVPKVVKHKIVLPIHLSVDNLVLSRNDDGYLFIRGSPLFPPNIISYRAP